MTLFAQADSEADDCLIVGPKKSNITRAAEASRFRITSARYTEPTEDSDGTVPLLEYVGPVGKSTRELIAEAFHGRDDGDDDDSPENTEAMTWLEDYLSENGETASKAVKDAAVQAGIGRHSRTGGAEDARLVRCCWLPAHNTLEPARRHRAGRQLRTDHRTPPPERGTRKCRCCQRFHPTGGRMTVTVAPLTSSARSIPLELGATGATGLDLHKRLGATGAVIALAPVAPSGRHGDQLKAQLDLNRTNNR